MGSMRDAQQAKRPLDCSAILSSRAKRRKPSAIRALQPLLAEPGMISLGGGMPNPGLFPIKGLSFTVAGTGEVVELPDSLVAEALQYSATAGLPELVQRLRRLQQHEHKPPVPEYALAVGAGSQDLLAKAFDTVLSEGDSLLLESPTYSGALAALEPIGVKYVCIETDCGGLVPSRLRSILAEWDASTRGPRPRVLYTIPTGSNPAGVSLSEERRDELYDVCREYDLLILEDDPYYFLQLQAMRRRSLFSRDVDGRVLRFDSFSKILSAGMRVGVATGPPLLLEKMGYASQSSLLHPSGVSQALMLQLFRHWGVGEDKAASPFGKLEKQIHEVNDFYASQLRAFEAAAEKHGLRELGVTWAVPDAGMFVWLCCENVADTGPMILEEARKHKFLMVPGAAFIPGGAQSAYVRAAYSTATPEQIDVALGRFAKLLRDKLTPDACAGP